MASTDTPSILTSSLVVSPIPIRSGLDHSPVRRRGSNSDVTDSPPRPRLSPTLTRSFNPNDPEARERQRTLDADMAIQLSRARSNTVHVSPSVSPLTPLARRLSSPDRREHDPIQFPTLSLQEEQDMTDARAGGHPHSTLDIDDPNSGTHFHPGPSPEVHLNHLSAAHDPTLLVSLTSADADAELGGLPMYQASVGGADDRMQYDFAHLEAFSREEKARLGIQSPSSPQGPPNPFTRPPPVPNQSQNANETDPSPSGSGAFTIPRVRHRKISQSSPTPRRGKLALFEQPGAAPPTAGTALSAVPSYENLPGIVGNGAPVGAGMSAQVAGGIGHDRPYRFSFYSNALSATIHARSLSELPAEGQSFEDLFLGRLPERVPSLNNLRGNINGRPNVHTTQIPRSGATSPIPIPASSIKTPNSQPRPGGGSNAESYTWWLDVLSPTDEEMKLLSKVFLIHPLTTEDIQMEETREKIELFRNYYLVCFRGFDQDPYSPTYLEPLNMYIIVFREGILSFHFRPTPHPQNVRRRIKQLKDYISVTSDWISYALIDDITDAFGPLIQSIEYEVDSIDELVLILKEAEQSDMLRRIGTCRKKVMGLLRLMGNKADVVKGLAKRCNENWRVAPTSDIGLYLSDIQDHLITMTQNLNHYEKILSRSHSNYLAQISIEMTEANNQINDVLSKLTALGTVLIPMNLVTGLWGMNVHVPGQEVEGYAWFFSIIGVLAAFAVVAGYSTYKLMVRR
ncbi:hypothetical protein AcW2_006134 [Taiwanofungus camphoratus]|nr:hypothetical protein AcW2_006134 [Antrodia cinnamomea]